MGATAGLEPVPRKHPTTKPKRKRERKPAPKPKARNVSRRSPARTKQPATRKPSPRIVLKKSDDVIARLRALESIGAYQSRKKITRQNITRKQANEILRRFDDIQKHGTYVRGKVNRPFKRTLSGYQLTPSFQFVKGDVKRSQPGIIKTKTGAVIDEPKNVRANVREDGTIVTRRHKFGKIRTTYSGSLTPKQTDIFLRQIEAGTFVMPKNMAMSLSIFGNDVSAEFFETAEQVAQSFMAKYGHTLLTYVRAHPDRPSPLKIEFYSL